MTLGIQNILALFLLDSKKNLEFELTSFELNTTVQETASKILISTKIRLQCSPTCYKSSN